MLQFNFIEEIKSAAKEVVLLSKQIEHQAEETVASIKRNGFALDDLKKGLDKPKGRGS